MNLKHPIHIPSRVHLETNFCHFRICMRRIHRPVTAVTLHTFWPFEVILTWGNREVEFCNIDALSRRLLHMCLSMYSNLSIFILTLSCCIHNAVGVSCLKKVGTISLSFREWHFCHYVNYRMRCYSFLATNFFVFLCETVRSMLYGNLNKSLSRWTSLLYSYTDTQTEHGYQYSFNQ